MEFNFSILRVSLMVSLIAGFYFLGGFDADVFRSDSPFSQGRLSRAKFANVVMFIVGAVHVSVIDHFVGNIDRSSIRFIYIIIGVMLMLGALIRLWLMKDVESMY